MSVDVRLPSPVVGKAILEFELPPIEGRGDGMSSADLRGQVSHFTGGGLLITLSTIMLAPVLFGATEWPP